MRPPKHAVTVKHEMHFGACRMVICECTCGWKSPTLPIKLHARLPVCGRVKPLVMTAQQEAEREHFGQFD